MSNNDIKTDLKPHHTPVNEPQSDKHALLLRLSIYMAWMGIFSLLISLVAHTQLNSKSSVTDTNNSTVREDG
ncbi:hypothetical protein [uncultured Psychrobacter sp.]|uniref:hypothetical protein n=1 Tax=uncultured Psychrobacter sp. TaxID=259303 RepID=UPI002631810B|nr:hypothetical protein [uncultured Psychrobacter sp.]